MITLDLYETTPTVKVKAEIDNYGIFREYLINNGSLMITNESAVKLADTLNFSTEEIKGSFRSKSNALIFVPTNKAYIIVMRDLVDFHSLVHHYSDTFIYDRFMKELI